MISQMSKNTILALLSTALLVTSLSLPASAKPVKFSDGVTFDFKGRFQSSDGNDVTCVVNFLSRNGERSTTIYRDGGYNNGSGVRITGS